MRHRFRMFSGQLTITVVSAEDLPAPVDAQYNPRQVGGNGGGGGGDDGGGGGGGECGGGGC